MDFLNVSMFQVLTEEEFVNMPPGEVDPDEENMDKEYEEE